MISRCSLEPECISSEAGISNTENDAKATDARARVIEKSDFESMAMVRQFNLGFFGFCSFVVFAIEYQRLNPEHTHSRISTELRAVGGNRQPSSNYKVHRSTRI